MCGLYCTVCSADPNDVIWGWNVVRSAKPAHDCSIDVFKGMRGSGVVQYDISQQVVAGGSLIITSVDHNGLSPTE